MAFPDAVLSGWILSREMAAELRLRWLGKERSLNQPVIEDDFDVTGSALRFLDV